MENAGAIDGAGAAGNGHRRQRNGSYGERVVLTELFLENYPEGGPMMWWSWSTTMSIVNSLLISYGQLGGDAYHNAGILGKVMINLMMICCIMPVVTWSSRRYGHLLPATCALILAFVPLYLIYYG